jgi:hypothetical protein
LIHIITAATSLLVYTACALLNLGADFELSPLEKNLLGMANAKVIWVSRGRKKAPVPLPEAAMQVLKEQAPCTLVAAT